MYCKKCGSFVSSGDNVCRMCGQRIDESVEQDSQSVDMIIRRLRIGLQRIAIRE